MPRGQGELIRCSLGSGVRSDVAVPVWGDSHWVTVGGDDLSGTIPNG